MRRRIGGDGQLQGNVFTILTEAGNQTQLAVAGAGSGRFFLAWQHN
jgi:hypothetical protein